MFETFQVFIPYSADTLESVSTIMGKKFNKKLKVYEFPSMEIYAVADAINELYPRIAHKLRTNAIYEKDRIVAQDSVNTLNLSMAKRARFDVPCPSNQKYEPYQKAAVYYATRGERDNLLLADEMGLGKTCTAIGIANHYKFKSCLVICPNSVKINWQREMLRWSTVTDNVVTLSSNSHPSEIQNCDYAIVNYEALKNLKSVLLTKKWNMVIGDEAQMIKGANTQRTQNTIELCDRADYRALLTGTPIVNRPSELWTIINTLNPVYWNNWYDYVHRYCHAFEHPKTGHLVYTGASNLEELQMRLRKTVMVRRLKKEVLKFLPPKRRQIIEFPATGSMKDLLKKQDKYIKILSTILEQTQSINFDRTPEEVEKEFRKAMARMRGIAKQDFDTISKIRHDTAMGKVPDVVSFAKEILESKNKIGIFGHHQDVLSAIEREFKRNSVKIVGGMSAEEKQRKVDLFQEKDKYQVFIGSFYAAGTGITLTKSDVCIFAEMDWVPGIMLQCEDRFHRYGTINPVNIFFLVLQNSIDVLFANMMISKLEIIEKATNPIRKKFMLKNGIWRKKP